MHYITYTFKVVFWTGLLAAALLWSPASFMETPIIVVYWFTSMLCILMAVVCVSTPETIAEALAKKPKKGTVSMDYQLYCHIPEFVLFMYAGYYWLGGVCLFGVFFYLIGQQQVQSVLDEIRRDNKGLRYPD